MVIHLRKVLVGPPDAVVVPGATVRHMAVPEDVPAWLALRVRAVADLTPSPRPWLHADFAAEMFDRPWWHSERIWLACAARAPQPVIGAVTLAIRESRSVKMPVVHWLIVDPAWQRRGIGRMLLSQLERATWESGFREVQLETHSGWAAAVAFYQSIGYAPVRAPAPR